LAFLAGPPDATNTTVSTDMSAANADNKETITVTLTPRDSHNNVVPLWTFRKDLTIVPSVNATVPGAVTVTTPAQDAGGNVTATLTYVDTSGQLLSKAARTGTTSVSIGSAVKKTFDTRFYPQVHICLTNLDKNGFVTPGTTEVHICDGSGHPIQSGSGYTVTAPTLSTSACPANGGGVCPSDAAGVKADFENLTGDDIRTLARTQVTFTVHDLYAVQDMTSMFTTGEIAFYGELKTHWPAADLGATKDLFRVSEAVSYCESVVRRLPDSDEGQLVSQFAADSVQTGVRTGGSVSNDAVMASVQMGSIASGIHTGGDTNPEIFVDGNRGGVASVPGWKIWHEIHRDSNGAIPDIGTDFPAALTYVNGRRGASKSWAMTRDGIDFVAGDTSVIEGSIGLRLSTATGWNLSDAYFVNNWPGAPYTSHKGNGDSAYHYVTQVNYITGYICAASLH
ncbi:Ig-like domain-containing protein, partial [Salmonella enterica]